MLIQDIRDHGINGIASVRSTIDVLFETPCAFIQPDQSSLLASNPYQSLLILGNLVNLITARFCMMWYC